MVAIRGRSSDLHEPWPAGTAVSAIDPVELTGALVRCPTVTPDVGPALDLLEARLAGLGFACWRLPFSEAGTVPVDNLFARFGTGGPHLAFAGHVDVVPTGPAERWRHPPFSGALADGYLYGRGATDMKSGVAAFVAAISEFRADGDDFEGSLSVIITGDEEGPAVNGTEKMLAWMAENGHTPDACIVGEPASRDAVGDQIKIGRRGSISGTLTVHGVQGHTAYPHLADNPIPVLAEVIRSIAAAPLDDGTAQFEPSTLAFSDVSTGNDATNVIPGAAAAAFNIRFNTEHDRAGLIHLLEARIAAGAAGHRVDLVLDDRHAAPFVTEDPALVAAVSAAIEAETGREPALSTGGGTSDARFIAAHCPVVEVGLTGRTMHAVDERVAVAEIETLTRVYKAIAARWFASRTTG